jgi:hypothetical protein
MTERDLIENEAILLKETPEQAARAISTALDFLRLEADAIGLLDVSDLIGRARAKIRAHCRPRNV